MEYENKPVRVGVSVLIKKDNKTLLIKRRGSHGEGTWAPPGGHLDFGESVFECADEKQKKKWELKLKI